MPVLGRKRRRAARDEARLYGRLRRRRAGAPLGAALRHNVGRSLRARDTGGGRAAFGRRPILLEAVEVEETRRRAAADARDPGPRREATGEGWPGRLLRRAVDPA